MRSRPLFAKGPVAAPSPAATERRARRSPDVPEEPRTGEGAKEHGVASAATQARKSHRDGAGSTSATAAPPQERLSRAEIERIYAESGYDLHTHPAHVIRRTHQRATALFQQVMRHRDLTPTQLAALAMILKHDELSQNQLGRLTAMDPSTISIVVRKLLKHSLIERRGSARDQRLSMIRLTGKGVRLTLACLPDSMEVARRLLSPLTPEEQETFLDLLHRIAGGDDASSVDI